MTTDMPVVVEPAERGKHHGKIIGFLVLIGLLLTLITALQVITLATRATPKWNPLGDYQTQIVTSRVAGVKGPAAKLAGSILVTGTKCNALEKAVTVRGSSFWQAVDAKGRNNGVVIPGFIGVGVRPPGCVTHHWKNQIPADVQIAVRGGLARWILAGSDVPIHSQGEGVPRLWITESFQLVP